MSLVVPNVGEDRALTKILTDALTLKLYSNNVTPGEADTSASYTEVSGGGYASKSLTLANWGIIDGVALYNAVQSFSFTGATAAPSVIYGYYVVDASNVLCWAERFVESVVPFTPVNGSIIYLTPRFTAS